MYRLQPFVSGVGIIIPFVLPWLLVGRLAAQTDENAESKAARILRASNASLLKIVSLECECSNTIVAEKTATQAESRNATTQRLIIDGKKYRREWYANLATPTGKPDVIETFDGRKVYDYRKSLDHLGMQSRPSVPVPSPYTFGNAYQWVIPSGKNHSWDLLLNKETWDAAIARSRPLGTVQQDNTTFEVIELTFPPLKDRKVAYRVYFQPDLEFYPLKYELLEDDQVTVVTTTLRHTKVKLGDSVLVVPLEVHTRASDKSRVGPHRHDTYLDEASFRVNPKVDNAIFVLSPDGVGEVTDADAK